MWCGTVVPPARLMRGMNMERVRWFQARFDHVIAGCHGNRMRSTAAAMRVAQAKLSSTGEHSRSSRRTACRGGGARSGLPMVLPRHASAGANIGAAAGPAGGRHLAAVPAEPGYAAGRHVAARLCVAQVRRRGPGAAAVRFDHRSGAGRGGDVPVRPHPPDAFERGCASAGALGGRVRTRGRTRRGAVCGAFHRRA